LTRQSIRFTKMHFAKKMDARVKPRHDGILDRKAGRQEQ